MDNGKDEKRIPKPERKRLRMRKRESGSEQDVIRASLFCDVEFWEYPVWDETEGTIFGYKHVLPTRPGADGDSILRVG